MAKKIRPQITVADPRLTAVVRRHLRALGLDTAEAYIAWCREHGFAARLNKTLQQRQEELKSVKKQASKQRDQTSLMEHIGELKLPSEEAYQAWCRTNGFGDGRHKSRAQRQQELKHARQLNGNGQAAIAIQHKRRRRDAIEQIARGEFLEHELTSPLLQRLAHLFTALEDQPDVNDAFLKLLLAVEKPADFFHVKPAYSGFGQLPENTFMDGLCALAQWHAFWIRDPAGWKPDSHNHRRQFGSLVRHMLAQYDVPACMDTAWFRGMDDRALQQQDWFIHVGSGKNIRKADIPIVYSKRMAHEFLNAPSDLNVESALRWAQIIGLGGDDMLAGAVIDTRLGESFHDEPFWESVIYFFINNPMLDTMYIGPIVDYIHNQRYVPQTRMEGEEVIEEEPPEPNFTMKGRTIDSILRRVTGWHRELAKEERKTPESWQSGGFNGFEYVEEDASAGEIKTWTIEEIRNNADLYDEGKDMHHCVASYKSSCARNQKSIWSLKVAHMGAKTSRRVLTISVENRSRKIIQVRGRNNTLPYKSESVRYRKGWELVYKWAEQERLTMPNLWSREMQPIN